MKHILFAPPPSYLLSRKIQLIHLLHLVSISKGCMFSRPSECHSISSPITLCSKCMNVLTGFRSEISPFSAWQPAWPRWWGRWHKTWPSQGRERGTAGNVSRKHRTRGILPTRKIPLEIEQWKREKKKYVSFQTQAEACFKLSFKRNCPWLTCLETYAMHSSNRVSIGTKASLVTLNVGDPSF